jgi:hypothetical protein
MKKIFLFLVLVALGAWWYFSDRASVLDSVSVETIEDVDSALGSNDVIDLDKELGSLDVEIEGL